MNIYVDLVTFTIETITYLIIAYSTLGISPSKTCHPFLYTLYYLVIGATLTHFLPDFLGWILLCILCLCMYKCIFRKSWFESLIINVICYISVVILQNIYILVTRNIGISNINVIAVSGSVFVLLVAWCICHFLSLSKLFKKFMQGNKFTKFLLIHVYIVFMLEIGIRKYSTIDTITVLPLITSFAVIIIITDIIILRQQQTITRQQHDLTSYKTYQPMMSDLIDDIRGRQHDFNNEIAAIRMLPFSYKDYDSLRDALINCSDLVISEYKEADLLKINLTVVAGFIHSKIIQAEKLGKQINVTIHEHTLKSQMPEYELIRVIGILVDNALEAVNQGDSISLHLDSSENRIIISTLNEGPELSQELRNKMFTRGYSTKTTNHKHHGQGLPNLKRLVDQYEGKVYIENSYNIGKTFVKIEVIV